MAEHYDLYKQISSARSEDVSTIDGIIRALYEVVSVAPGQEPDWERDRSLYVPGARLVPTGVDPVSGPHAIALDIDGYAERTTPKVSEGFYEYEIHRITKSFGRITAAISTYEAKRSADGPVIARGVNFIQLVHAANRWWIISIAWDVEREDNPIPPEYLPTQSP